jgi:segregation and condensation protein B
MPPKKPAPSEQPPAAGFHAPPADGGLSIDRLAQAFAAMMGTGDPYAADAASAPDDLVHVDASPDLDDGFSSSDDDATCRVSPSSILEALLFVGLPGGEPLTSRKVAGLMRGVRPQEVDELAEELRRKYVANNCPYEVVSKEAGWVLRLRPEFAQFGSVLETRSRLVRLDGESLDVLAVVAWNQPVARDKLVELGSDASPSILRTLVRRGLLELVPEADAVGEPCYRTTKKFLEVFKLDSLADLPNPTAPPQ